jgi:hypothetical protein
MLILMRSKIVDIDCQVDFLTAEMAGMLKYCGEKSIQRISTITVMFRPAGEA